MSSAVPALTDGLTLQQFMLPYLDQALGRMTGVTNSFVYFFGGVSIVTIGLRYMFSHEDHIATLRWLGPQVITMLMLGWLCTHLSEFASMIHWGLTLAGLKSGGYAEETTPLYNPQAMWDITWSVYKNMTSSCGLLDWVNPFTLIGAGLAGIAMLICGVTLFLFTLLKIYHFKAIVIAGAVMVPAGLWKRTASIAEDWLTHVLNGSMSMFMLAVCISLPFDYFKEYAAYKNWECNVTSFVWTSVAFLVWTFLTISMTNTFSRLISRAILIYGKES